MSAVEVLLRAARLRRGVVTGLPQKSSSRKAVGVTFCSSSGETGLRLHFLSKTMVWDRGGLWRSRGGEILGSHRKLLQAQTAAPKNDP